MIDRSRGSPALKKFFIEEFAGTLVTDFWGAYNAVACALRQTCLAHLLRELEHTEKYKSPVKHWPAFAKKLRRLLGDAIRLWRRRGELSEGEYASRRERIADRLRKLIDETWQDVHAKRLIKRLRRHQNDLFTFLDQPNVPFDNNAAERAINITFNFTNAGSSGYLAQWAGSYYVPQGTDLYPWTSGVTHKISFNADHFTGTHYTWWDPTPATSDDLPSVTWDALSVARHELGHALGFTDGFYYDNFGTDDRIDKWSSHITGTTFDPGGLNVSMDSASNLSHLLDDEATAGDLMVPALPNGLRRDISTTDLNMLQLAYGYQLVPEPSPLVLLVIGVVGVWGVARLRRRQIT